MTLLQITTTYAQKCKAFQPEWIKSRGSLSAKEYSLEQSLQTNPAIQEMPGEQNSTTRTTHLAANGDGTESIEPTPSNSDKRLQHLSRPR